LLGAIAARTGLADLENTRRRFWPLVNFDGRNQLGAMVDNFGYRSALNRPGGLATLCLPFAACRRITHHGDGNKTREEKSLLHLKLH
jgi:hypothetical protein